MSAAAWKRRTARAALACSPLALVAAPVAATPAGGAGCDPSWPVTAFHATAGAPEPANVTMPVACGSATGYPTSETTLGVANSGALLFSPANTENTLARSEDNGRAWTLVGPTRLQYTSLWNTVDPAVVVDRQTGRVFWVHTTYTEDLRWPLPDQSAASWLVPTAVADAHGFQVFSSSDEGTSWSTADYQRENTADWEKLFVGPPPPRSSGAAQPTRYPNIVYVCANAPQEIIGPGRACYKSLDGGATFTATGYQFPSAAAPADCPPLAANTGVVDSGGVVYIPQSCYSGTYLAVSRDEGASFAWLPVTGAPPANGLGAVVQLAIDGGDDLYVLWTAGDALRLARSDDHGRSWKTPLTVSARGLHNITLPALAGGGRGAVGVVYYATAQASAHTLSAYVAQTSEAAAPAPLFYTGAVNDPAHPIFENYGQGTSPRADFVGAAFDASGRFWGGVVQQLSPPDAGNRIATSGYVGRLEFPGPVSRPPIAACHARRLVIALPRRRRARITSASVFVNGSRLLEIHGRRLTRVVILASRLRSFTVTVVATTNRHARIVIVRRYQGCSRTRGITRTGYDTPAHGSYFPE